MKPPQDKQDTSKILHIGKYFPPHYGGMETILRDQMHLQSRQNGVEVAAVVHSSERRLLDRLEVTDHGCRLRRSATWFTAIFAPIAPLFWYSVAIEIKKLDPDEIIIHMPNLSAFWLLLMPSARSRKWVVLWHSDVLPSKHNIGLRYLYWLYKPFESFLLNRSSRIIATSPTYLQHSKPLAKYTRKCSVEALRLDRQRIPSHFLAASQPQKTPAEGVRVLCVGRLTYYKSFDTAIEAIALIPNAELRIIGDGELRRSLERLISDLGLTSRVKLLGHVSDETLWQHYTWCDVHCLPSCERTEAFGLSVTEAAMFNRPSVVSNLPHSGLVWNAEQTGVPFAFATPKDPTQFAAKILEVFENQIST